MLTVAMGMYGYIHVPQLRINFLCLAPVWTICVGIVMESPHSYVVHVDPNGTSPIWRVLFSVVLEGEGGGGERERERKKYIRDKGTWRKVFFVLGEVISPCYRMNHFWLGISDHSQSTAAADRK